MYQPRRSGRSIVMRSNRGGVTAWLPRKVQAAALKPLSIGLSASLRRVSRLRPEIFERLALSEEKAVRVCPTDLPLVFILLLGGADPRVVTEPAPGTSHVDAAIEAPLRTLLGIFEGREDGDAAFFSSDLWIEGDTALVLGLRNAVEEAELRLSDLLPVTPPAPLKTRVDAAADFVLERLG